MGRKLRNCLDTKIARMLMIKDITKHRVIFCQELRSVIIGQSEGQFEFRQIKSVKVSQAYGRMTVLDVIVLFKDNGENFLFSDKHIYV